MGFLEILKSIVFGIVQGISEWLPISSTGHMILLNEIMPFNFDKNFVDTFLVVVQLGSILAVLVLYFHRLNPFSPKKNRKERKATLSIWGKVIIGCLPAAVIGLLFDDVIDKKFFNWQTVSVTLILYGILFIIIESKQRTPEITSIDKMGYSTAFAIGLFQVLALIPGTSRSGSTIIGAMIIGTSRVVAAEYSFFLSLPVMFGASALKIIKTGLSFDALQWITLIVGMVVAFIVSVIAIKFLMNYIKRNSFKPFGYYRIVLGIVVILYFLLTSTK